MHPQQPRQATNEQAQAAAKGVGLLHDILNTLQGLAQQQATTANASMPANNISMVVLQFLQFEPPVFNGRDGPLAAEEWLRALERIFTLLACTDAQRISCALFQLIEDADHWWEAYVRMTTEEQLLEMTWEGLKETIMQKYVPRSYLFQKQNEFFSLEQGNMSVTEYERKFIRLSRYAPQFVNTDDIKMARKFTKGLRPEIRVILAGQGAITFAEAIELAHAIYTSMNLESLAQESGESSRKRKCGHCYGGGNGNHPGNED